MVLLDFILLWLASYTYMTLNHFVSGVYISALFGSVVYKIKKTESFEDTELSIVFYTHLLMYTLMACFQISQTYALLQIMDKIDFDKQQKEILIKERNKENDFLAISVHTDLKYEPPVVESYVELLPPKPVER